MRRNVLKVVMGFVGLLFGLTGCGTVGNPKPEFLGNNRWQINVSGFGGFTASTAVTRDWNAAASKACDGRSYNIITRSFTGKEQNGMEGIVECQ
jgi:hypothetical protein